MKNYIPHIIIAFAVIVGSYLLGKAYMYKTKTQETISVTGLGEVNFESDQVIWSATFRKKSQTIKDAYALIKNDEIEVKKYLNSKGIKDAELSFSSVNTSEDYDYSNEERIFKGYILSQSVTVDSKQLDNVIGISKSISELLDKGIEIESGYPEFYYSKLSTLKHDVLKSASEDGKIRAEKIAESSGVKLGDLKKANMGIFQITSQNGSDDYSWGGAFNTTSRSKRASITVKMEFKIN